MNKLNVHKERSKWTKQKMRNRNRLTHNTEWSLEAMKQEIILLRKVVGKDSKKKKKGGGGGGERRRKKRRNKQKTIAFSFTVNLSAESFPLTQACPGWYLLRSLRG